MAVRPCNSLLPCFVLSNPLGLAAEEVERVEPSLAFHNKQGEIEGVKYNQLTAVLINAIKEQQHQIQQQQSQLKQQQSEIATLERLVCRNQRHVMACR